MGSETCISLSVSSSAALKPSMSSGMIAPRLQRRNSFSNTTRHAFGRTKKRIDIAHYQHNIYALLRPNQHIRHSTCRSQFAALSLAGAASIRNPRCFCFALACSRRGDSIKQSSIICASLMLAQIKATPLYDVSLANRGSRCSRSWAPPA